MCLSTSPPAFAILISKRNAGKMNLFLAQEELNRRNEKVVAHNAIPLQSSEGCGCCCCFFVPFFLKPFPLI